MFKYIDFKVEKCYNNYNCNIIIIFLINIISKVKNADINSEGFWIMKVKLIAAALAVGMILSGCGSEGTDILINADGYEGILATEEGTTVTAASVPESTVKTVNTTVSHTSGISENSDISNSSDTSYSADSAETVSAASEEPSPETETAATAAAEPETELPVTTVPATIETVSEETAETSTAAPETTTAASETSTAAETTVTTTVPPATEPEISFEDGSSSYRALNYSEVKGVWISYLELNTLLTGKNEWEFTVSIREAFKNCADMGLNTVFVHVRSHGDAYYKSEYYPWSKYVTGTLGQAPDFDPLEIMIKEAHSLGLSFQAWINPYRLCGVSEMKNVSEKYPVGNWYKTSEGKRVVAEGSYYYLNPGYSESNELIASGVKEILLNYQVDGIHIDDYFYPTTDASFDKAAFSDSGYSSLSAFRTDNCTKTVKALYNAVKETNSTALFGIAPQGNIQNNYDFMYADVKTWCAGSGYIDYIMPQIYFGFKNKAQPYDGVLDDWQDMVSGSSVKLIPGLGVYKIGNEDSYGGSDGRYEWLDDAEIIKRQIISAEGKVNYGGFVLYSYSHVFDPDTNAAAKLTEMEAVKNYIV